MAGVSKHYNLYSGERNYLDHAAVDQLEAAVLRLQAVNRTTPERAGDIKKACAMTSFRKKLLAMWVLVKAYGKSGNFRLTEYLVRPGVSANKCAFRKLASNNRAFRPKKPKLLYGMPPQAPPRMNIRDALGIPPRRNREPARNAEPQPAPAPMQWAVIPQFVAQGAQNFAIAQNPVGGGDWIFEDELQQQNRINRERHEQRLRERDVFNGALAAARAMMVEVPEI